MCIKDDGVTVVKNGPMVLWKVIRKDNIIGIWRETKCDNGTGRHFRLGNNHAKPFGYNDHFAARFHCFIKRKDARRYRNLHKTRAEIYWDADLMGVTKIIKIYAHSSSVVDVGYDIETGIRAISVSKMKIKSLRHQR